MISGCRDHVYETPLKAGEKPVQRIDRDLKLMQIKMLIMQGVYWNKQTRLDMKVPPPDPKDEEDESVTLSEFLEEDFELNKGDDKRMTSEQQAVLKHLHEMVTLMYPRIE